LNCENSYKRIFLLANSDFEEITGFGENVYVRNWLLVSAILLASGVLFLLRLGRARRRVRRGSPAAAEA
jgi:hypothetical protein